MLCNYYFDLDIALKWAQIISTPLAAVALIIAINNARPYRKRMAFAIQRLYNLDANRNNSSFHLHLILSNSSLVPLIISEIRIKMNKSKGSYFMNQTITESKINILSPGTSKTIDIQLFDQREFQKEFCSAKAKVTCIDVDGKAYSKRIEIEQDFSKLYKTPK